MIGSERSWQPHRGVRGSGTDASPGTSWRHRSGGMPGGCGTLRNQRLRSCGSCCRKISRTPTRPPAGHRQPTRGREMRCLSKHIGSTARRSVARRRDDGRTHIRGDLRDHLRDGGRDDRRHGVTQIVTAPRAAAPATAPPNAADVHRRDLRAARRRRGNDAIRRSLQGTPGRLADRRCGIGARVRGVRAVGRVGVPGSRQRAGRGASRRRAVGQGAAGRDQPGASRFAVHQRVPGLRPRDQRAALPGTTMRSQWRPGRSPRRRGPTRRTPPSSLR